MPPEVKRFVSRKVYGATIEADRNWVVLRVVVASAGPAERRTAQWQARPAVGLRRGKAPARTVDAANFAARPGVVVSSTGDLPATRGSFGRVGISSVYVT